MMAAALQVWMLATGLLGLWLSLQPGDWQQRWGVLIGLAGQPAWLWVTAHAGQWGMLLLSLASPAVWLHGVWRHWIAAHDLPMRMMQAVSRG